MVTFIVSFFMACFPLFWFVVLLVLLPPLCVLLLWWLWCPLHFSYCYYYYYYCYYYESEDEEQDDDDTDEWRGSCTSWCSSQNRITLRFILYILSTTVSFSSSALSRYRWSHGARERKKLRTLATNLSISLWYCDRHTYDSSYNLAKMSCKPIRLLFVCRSQLLYNGWPGWRSRSGLTSNLYRPELIYCPTHLISTCRNCRRRYYTLRHSARALDFAHRLRSRARYRYAWVSCNDACPVAAVSVSGVLHEPHRASVRSAVIRTVNASEMVRHK